MISDFTQIDFKLFVSPICNYLKKKETIYNFVVFVKLFLKKKKKSP